MPGCQEAFLIFLCVICACSLVGAMAQTPSVIILIRYISQIGAIGRSVQYLRWKIKHGYLLCLSLFFSEGPWALNWNHTHSECCFFCYDSSVRKNVKRWHVNFRCCESVRDTERNVFPQITNKMISYLCCQCQIWDIIKKRFTTLKL